MRSRGEDGGTGITRVSSSRFGNVSSESLKFPTGGLLYAAGPGLRYLTPVGPARIDFGYQLKQESGLRVNGNPESRHWRIHFSIGQAF